ncbi:hypothetical protein BKA70DRAFT_1185879 [Coprinopsis sp. MPI-PUGE-AT-0042]|nr:hypothetical protein BKA70DRAFT_1185879 [Coprinopsis sp. MPI-PUGE-AT-0042]
MTPRCKMDDGRNSIALSDGISEVTDRLQLQPISLTQELSGVQVTGGNLNIVGGNQHHHQHFHQHSYTPTEATDNEIPHILEQVPNYRDIHGANLSRATAGTGPCFDQWDQFHEWSGMQGVLKTMWGSGMPGAGKTIFVSIVINEVESRAEASESPICVGYIYFRYSDHATATVGDFLEVLVKQTIERHSSCIPTCKELYARHIREKTRPSDAELLQLLRKFSTLMEATFYFLEALDEAPSDIQLDLLEKLTSLNVKLFITSRPLTALEARFPAAHLFPIIAQDRDLDLHIAKELSRSILLQNILNQGDPMLRERITSTIKRKCGGMFLHASLQLDALRDCASAYDVEKTLEDFPPQIEGVYQQTWTRILNQTPNMVILAKNVLVWVLCATRALRIEELCSFIATCPETHKFDCSRRVEPATLMVLCRGLVNVEEKTDVVRFVHYTAKDVVEHLISGSSPYPHSLPVLICMALLTERGFQCFTINTRDALNKAMKADTLVEYAYGSWSIHAHKLLDSGQTADQLAAFIQGCHGFPVDFGCDPFFPICLLEPLHMAAYFDLPITLAGPAHLLNPNQLTLHGGARTPLTLAIHMNSLNAMKELLNLPRILVNAADGHEWTPLMSALGLDQWPKSDVNHAMVALLLAHPQVDVNASSDSRLSPLMRASKEDSEEAVSLLLAHPRTKPNQVNSEGHTALMLASRYGYRHIVKLLVADPCVNIHLRSKSGQNALDMAKEEMEKWPSTFAWLLAVTPHAAPFCGPADITKRMPHHAEIIELLHIHVNGKHLCSRRQKLKNTLHLVLNLPWKRWTRNMMKSIRSTNKQDSNPSIVYVESI